MSEQGTLKWRFDVSTFQLIGRELITDRVTALFELVKNSYDANARKVSVIFENVQPSKDNPEVPVLGSRITIKDDGYGMTPEIAKLCKQYCGAVAVSWYRSEYTLRAIEMLLDAVRDAIA